LRNTKAGQGYTQTAKTLEIKFLLLRNNYVCPIRIFIFDTDQAQNYSVIEQVQMKR